MSSEVGAGHISIFPVMTGFKSTVARETKAAGLSGARTFGDGFKGAGTAAGRALGKDMKSALASSARDLAGVQMSKLKADVASASAALSKARMKQQDDAGRARVAEARLQEVVKRSGAESAAAVAASERLASARRTEAATTEIVAAATARLSSAKASLSDATARVAIAGDRSVGSLRQMSRNLRDGFRDANAARSSFTGLAGSVGGLLRGLSDVTGLSSLGRLAKLGAMQASKAFTTMATMVGGKLASAWRASSTWVGGVGARIGSALAPIGRVAASAGSALASPFIKLGSKVSTWMSPVTSQVGGLFRKIGQTVAPAFSGIASSVRGIAGSVGSAASSAFQSVVGAASRAASSAGRALGSGLQSAATGAVTIAAAGIGIAFTKGFSRLASIDTAQAKLRGLGNDAATVTTIMGDAMASVRGTSFGLGEAATVAAAAVAAGIKPGETLQGHLKRIANNASAAGLSMQDMGSIFNKAATQANGVQNDVISQLADKGIPIYQALADQMGVTAGEVFKLASEGKVDFETFSKAAEKAAGTVAAEMGKTVPGAAKNFFAAMGRIGANALGGIYTKIGPLIQAATSALGPIEEKAKAFGDVLLKRLGPALDWLTNLFNKIGSGAKIFEGGLSGLTGLVGPLGGAFAALGAGGLAGLLAKLGPLSAMLPGLGRGLALLGGPLGIAAAAFAGFALTGGDVDGLVSGITGIVDQIVAALPGLIAAVVTIVPKIIDALLGAVPGLLSAGAEIVTVLIDGIVSAIPMLVAGALKLVLGLVQAITTNLPAIIDGAIVLVTALLDGIVQALPLLIQGALTLVTALLGGIVAALPAIIEGGVKLLMSLIQGIVQALPMLLEAALGLVMGLLQAIIENLPLIIEAGIQLLLSLVQGIVDSLPMLIEMAITLVLQLVAGLIEMLPQLVEAGIALVVALIGGLIEAIPQIVAMLPQIVEAIWTALTEVDWASLGMQIIQGIIDGFGQMFGAIGDAVGGVVDFITGFFPHSPAKRGPLSGAGWGRFKGSGKSLMAQFNAGAAEEATAFGDTVAALASDASRRAQVSLSAVTAGGLPSAPSASGGGSQLTVQQEVNLAHMDPEVAVRMANNELAAVIRSVM